MLATINDKKLATDDGNGEVAYYEADVVTANDYYPFGMIMPGRKYAFDSTYRYGFNGKEQDNDINSLTAYDYGFRIYNPAIAKFLSVDPLFKSYPWNSPYAFAENEPISNIDLDGLEKYKVTIRTFLPYTYVWEPQSSDIIDKANTRWYPQYRNVEAHGGFKSEQQFEVDFYSVKTKYSPSPIPDTYSKNLQTGEISKF
jgi:RHS repeat-associated protein